MLLAFQLPANASPLAAPHFPDRLGVVAVPSQEYANQLNAHPQTAPPPRRRWVGYLTTPVVADPGEVATFTSRARAWRCGRTRAPAASRSPARCPGRRRWASAW